MSHCDKCIVLDLDETLVHTYASREIIYNDMGYNYLDSNIQMRGRLIKLEDDLWSLKRPNTDTFLRYVMDNFRTVVVWSAGTKDYVNAIVDWIFGSIGLYPDKVFSRDYCDEVPVGSNKKAHVKPIIKLAGEPDLKGKLRLDNTFFIDDNTTSTSPNPSNAVTIPRFQPDQNIRSMLMENDDALLKIIYWLEGSTARKCEDVRKVDKTQATVFRPRMQTSSILDSIVINYPNQNIVCIK